MSVRGEATVASSRVRSGSGNRRRSYRSASHERRASLFGPARQPLSSPRSARAPPLSFGVNRPTALASARPRRSFGREPARSRFGLSLFSSAPRRPRTNARGRFPERQKSIRSAAAIRFDTHHCFAIGSNRNRSPSPKPIRACRSAARKFPVRKILPKRRCPFLPEAHASPPRRRFPFRNHIRPSE